MFLTSSQAYELPTPPLTPNLSQLKTLPAFLTFLLLSPCLIFFSYSVCFYPKGHTVLRVHAFSAFVARVQIETPAGIKPLLLIFPPLSLSLSFTKPYSPKSERTFPTQSYKMPRSSKSTLNTVTIY